MGLRNTIPQPFILVHMTDDLPTARAAFPVAPVVASKVLPVVISKIVPAVTAKVVPIVISKVVSIIPAKVIQVSAAAHRFHHLTGVTVTAFDHNEISADFTVTTGEHLVPHRMKNGNRLWQAVIHGVGIPVHLITDHISEHTANRRTDEGRLSIPADSLTDQSTAPRPHQQSVDSISLGLDLHGQSSQYEEYCNCKLECIYD